MVTIGYNGCWNAVVGGLENAGAVVGVVSGIHWSTRVKMNDYTKMVYVVEDEAWWSFTAKQWIAFFPVALAGMRSGKGYKLPDANRLDGPPRCAQRIDGEDAWCSDRNDTEIFCLVGWELQAWEEESAMMQESEVLG